MLLCKPAAMPISTPGEPFDFPASWSLERPVKSAAWPLSVNGWPMGSQPVSPILQPASPGMRTSPSFGGAGGRFNRRDSGWAGGVLSGGGCWGGAGCCWAGACVAAGCWSAGAAAASCGACAWTSIDDPNTTRQSKPVREIFTYASTPEISRHGPVQDHRCTNGSKPFNCWLPFYFASNQRHAAGNPRDSDCGSNGTGVEFA